MQDFQVATETQHTTYLNRKATDTSRPWLCVGQFHTPVPSRVLKLLSKKMTKIIVPNSSISRCKEKVEARGLESGRAASRVRSLKISDLASHSNSRLDPAPRLPTGDRHAYSTRPAAYGQQQCYNRAAQHHPGAPKQTQTTPPASSINHRTIHRRKKQAAASRTNQRTSSNQPMQKP